MEKCYSPLTNNPGALQVAAKSIISLLTPDEKLKCSSVCFTFAIPADHRVQERRDHGEESDPVHKRLCRQGREAAPLIGRSVTRFMMIGRSVTRFIIHMSQCVQCSIRLVID